MSGLKVHNIIKIYNKYIIIKIIIVAGIKKRKLSQQVGVYVESYLNKGWLLKLYNVFNKNSLCSYPSSSLLSI